MVTPVGRVAEKFLSARIWIASVGALLAAPSTEILHRGRSKQRPYGEQECLLCDRKRFTASYFRTERFGKIHGRHHGNDESGCSADDGGADFQGGRRF